MQYNVNRVQKGWVIKYITYNMQYNVNRVQKGWVIGVYLVIITFSHCTVLV